MSMRHFTICLLTLLLGCRTPRSHDRGANLALTPEQTDFAEALAHFAQGLIYEKEYGTPDTRTIDEFEKAAALDPGRRRIHSKIALGYLLRQEPDKAIRTLEAACRANPEDLQARIDLAVACQVSGRDEEAIRHFGRAVEMAPGEAFLYMGLARLHFRADNDSAAVDALRRGAKNAEDPRPILALAAARGRQLVERGELEPAVRYFEFLVGTGDMRRPELHNLIGQIYIELRQPENAARNFRTATMADSPVPDSFVKLAAIQLRQGQPAAAAETLNRGRADFPDNPMILSSLALAYNAQQRYPDAVKVLEHLGSTAALNDREKLTPEFYLQYGATCDRAGDVAKAERILSSCVQQYPEAHEALNYLAYLWAERDVNIPLALEYVRRALEQEPDNPAYLDTLGWIYYRQGRYEEALEEIRKADELMGDDPVITEHLGDVYDALDRRDRAIGCWRKSFLLDPDSKELPIKLEAYGVDMRQLRKELRKAGKEGEAESGIQ